MQIFRCFCGGRGGSLVVSLVLSGCAPAGPGVEPWDQGSSGGGGRDAGAAGQSISGRAGGGSPGAGTGGVGGSTSMGGTSAGGRAGGTNAGSGGMAGGGMAGGGMAGGGGEPPSGRKFEPSAGKTLLFIGQHVAASDEYVRDTGDVPAGFMSYTSFDLEAFESTYFQYYFHYPDRYPGTAMQLALYFRDTSSESDRTLERILAGDYDARIDALATRLESRRIPVFLRIEYEVNNNFPPALYPAVFRHVRRRLEQTNGVDHIAYVWHVTVNGTLTGEDNHFDWYPGDDVVDWIAVSFFEEAVGYLPSGPMDPEIFENVYQENLARISDYARLHRIPLMVAEASPQKHFLPSRPGAWDGYYRKLFDYIERYDVKALCYINENWPDFGWDARIWGDSRVQSNADVRTRWFGVVNGTRYVHGARLYGEIGFLP